MIYPLLIISYLVSKTIGGPVDTCDDQERCLDISVEPILNSNEFRVCLTFNRDRPGCDKGDAISHVCPTDNEEDKIENWKHKDYRTMCKIVGCGSIAKFGIKDGKGCARTKSLTGVSRGDINGITCSYDGGYCGGGNKKDCSWEVPTPSCPDIGECPAYQPQPGDYCDWGDNKCCYGKESCCGETFDSFCCKCIDGTAACYNTDACLKPYCEPACPEDTKKCECSGETLVRDPDNDCKFPDCKEDIVECEEDPCKYDNGECGGNYKCTPNPACGECEAVCTEIVCLEEPVTCCDGSIKKPDPFNNCEIPKCGVMIDDCSSDPCKYNNPCNDNEECTATPGCDVCDTTCSCKGDLRTCCDGSTVRRNPSNNCEFDTCSKVYDDCSNDPCKYNNPCAGNQECTPKPGCGGCEPVCTDIICPDDPFECCDGSKKYRNAYYGCDHDKCPVERCDGDPCKVEGACKGDQECEPDDCNCKAVCSPRVCTTDVKECCDGTTRPRDPFLMCAFPECPPEVGCNDDNNPCKYRNGGCGQYETCKPTPKGCGCEAVCEDITCDPTPKTCPDGYTVLTRQVELGCAYPRCPACDPGIDGYTFIGYKGSQSCLYPDCPSDYDVYNDDCGCGCRPRVYYAHNANLNNGGIPKQINNNNNINGVNNNNDFEFLLMNAAVSIISCIMVIGLCLSVWYLIKRCNAKKYQIVSDVEEEEIINKI